MANDHPDQQLRTAHRERFYATADIEVTDSSGFVTFVFWVGIVGLPGNRRCADEFAQASRRDRP